MTSGQRLALLIPAYNAVAFLPRLFESIARQAEPFDEVWLYDDCSTDGTAELAEQLGARVLRGDVNRGCSYGKDVLLRRTGCGWIHFHDADDLLEPGFAAAARRWIVRDTADVVAFGCDEVWDDTRQRISLSVPDHSALAADPVGYTIRHKINAISGLYRRDAVIAAGGFDLDPEVLYNEDQAFHAKLARAGLRFAGEPQVLVTNLKRRASMSTGNQARCIRARYHVLLKTLHGPGGDRHHDDIAAELWIAAASAASHLDWRTADDAATLAARLAGPSSAPSGAVFRALCRISPRLALRVRESLVRTLKPQLREGFPPLRLTSKSAW